MYTTIQLKDGLLIALCLHALLLVADVGKLGQCVLTLPPSRYLKIAKNRNNTSQCPSKLANAGKYSGPLTLIVLGAYFYAPDESTKPKRSWQLLAINTGHLSSQELCFTGTSSKTESWRDKNCYTICQRLSRLG